MERIYVVFELQRLGGDAMGTFQKDRCRGFTARFCRKLTRSLLSSHCCDCLPAKEKVERGKENYDHPSDTGKL